MSQKLIVFLGKSASGKDAIMKEFVKETGIKEIKQVTTRPRREHETNEYIFMDEKTFLSDVSKGLIVAVSEFRTEKGCWRYGVRVSDLNGDENKCIISNPTSLFDLLEHTTLDTILATINRPLKDRVLSSMERDGLKNANEILRRIVSDECDFDDPSFKECYNHPKVRWCMNINNYAHKTIFDIVSEIRNERYILSKA